VLLLYLFFTGRTGDANGNLVNWWTHRTLDNYLKETECFENQYNDYRIPELAEEEVRTAIMWLTMRPSNLKGMDLNSMHSTKLD